MLRWIVAVVVVMAALVALLWISQRRIIYFPTQTVPSIADVNQTIEEVSFQTGDGLTLNA